MLMRFLHYSQLILLTFVLMACSPIHMPNQKMYSLSTVNPSVIHAKKTQNTLLVTMPTATSAYATHEMAYVIKPFRVDYFSENRWVDQPTHLLQPLLVQSLRQTQHFKEVIASPYTGHADYRIDTQILQMEQNFTCQPSRMALSISVNIMNNQTQRIIASRIFSITIPAPSDDPYGGVLAANQAVADLLGKISRFVVTQI
jgi:cholesterol transport system auxiliary component